jgi:RNA 2',3'-cyclic 3'-phosphodiesterase
VRLFIAIPLPPDIAQRAFAVLPQALPALRRVQPENLHMTLAFLGETPESRLPEVAGATEEAATGVGPFRLAFGPAGRFPERGRPRVVWLGVAEGRASLERLGTGLSRALRECALDFEDRPLSPHLTLARVREDASTADSLTVANAVEALTVVPLEVHVSAIAIVRSVLSPKGSRYTTLATVPLTA